MGRAAGETPALLREHGFTWCSPAGEVASVQGGLAFVPFAWELVDAYHLMERFRELRGGSYPLSPPALTNLLTAALGQPDAGRGDRLAAGSAR